MRKFRLYITDEDVKSKLGKEYEDKYVIFTNASVNPDNTITFEGFVVNDEIPSDDIGRERLL